jgi:putative ABC transport system substrate-binding protein
LSDTGKGRAAHFADLAQDVVRREPDVIISSGIFLTLDFKAATTTIPIVGLFGYPVELGAVSSLARPGGNITGVTFNIGGSSGTSESNCCGRWCRI